MNEKIIIAIDGHSSCGKSTLAKDLAQELSYIYVDTGAMYRAMALFADQQGLIKDNKVTDIEKFKTSLSDVSISFDRDKEGKLFTKLNDTNVEKEIRSMRVSNMVSYVSSLDFVREKLVKSQQQLGKNKGIVMDGRDIGTVVFPEAEVKIFLTAPAKIRAQRRYDELNNKGETVKYEEVLDNIISRDYMDEHREISPLRKADDAITLDNSSMTPKQQLAYITTKIMKSELKNINRN